MSFRDFADVYRYTIADLTPLTGVDAGLSQVASRDAEENSTLASGADAGAPRMSASAQAAHEEAPTPASHHGRPPIDAAPAFTVAIALAAGMVSQALAHHLRIPGIVILLVVGVLLGPDLLGIIHPESLGPALQAVVGFAVAVILFEGGMQLDLRRVWREGRAIRNLSTIGAMITAILATLAAKYLLNWDWTPSVLFGSLMMVTGPTVINPLVRRIRLEPRTGTVLEAEGIIVDAIGSVVAVVALEHAIARQTAAESGLGWDALAFLKTLGVGALVGAVGGWFINWMMRLKNVIPEESRNVFILAQVMLIFQLANYIQTESGIAAAITAGLIVGAIQTSPQKELAAFKEQLTAMFIGLIFVLLAADVRLMQIEELGWGGVAVVALLIFAIRPIAVFVSTWGSDLSIEQRSFISWIGPRGIIAAAVASLFAVELDNIGVGGGRELRAMVFLVIASTVVISGLTGSQLAGMLGLRLPSNSGWLVLGANELGRTLARLLERNGEEVICIDSSPDAVRGAREEGLSARLGNALDEDFLERMLPESRRGLIGLTPNEEVNLLFARRASAHGSKGEMLVSLRTLHEGVTPKMVTERGGGVLFGGCVDTRAWNELIGRGGTQLVRLTLAPRSQPVSADIEDLRHARYLPIAQELESGEMVPVTNRMIWRRADVVHFLIASAAYEETMQLLHEAGWREEKGEASDTEEDPSSDEEHAGEQGDS